MMKGCEYAGGVVRFGGGECRGRYFDYAGISGIGRFVFLIISTTRVSRRGRWRGPWLAEQTVLFER